MTFYQEIWAIIVGVILADGLFKLCEIAYDRWKNKDIIKLEELKCDLCHEARKLVRTIDEKHFWLCATCMSEYIRESGYSDLEKEKILDSYKKRIKRRGRRKK